ncbi:uncharacterized protein LOC135390485 [Ornithodoros turicata]|uniref:uncharacterized protein LOC135390485 n=1 Tax=Ornithodoros turicata TaxID=34597 RepID=UPI00313A2553
MSTSDILFYTGLSEEVFQKILLCLEQSFRPLSQLPLEDQLVLALMRLRLGTLYRDLAWRFSISPSSVCKIFNSVLKSLNEIMTYSVVWLPKSGIQSSMPDSFIQSGYENTRCILDCTEVFLQRPKKQMARAQTYSSYKAHNILKFLIVIAPNGFIMYVSKAYGGQASDKFIVKDCGILEYFARNDEIMAERGFTLDPYLAAEGVKLNVPAFTRDFLMLSGDVEKNPGPTPEQMLAQILANQDSDRKLLQSIQLSQKQTEASLRDPTKTVGEIESQVKNLESVKAAVQDSFSRITLLEQTVTSLSQKVEDLESRSRRNNLIIYGTEEKESESQDDLLSKEILSLETS